VTTASPLLGTTTLLTITLNSLATDPNLLIGRQSTVINGVTDDAIDALIGGKFVSAASGTLAASKQIEVWAFASYDDGTTYNGGAGATDAGLTVTTVKKALFRLVTIIPTDTSLSSVYAWGPFSLAQVFGGVIPTRWGLWVVQNTALALNAAGNEIRYTPVKFESA
jgi:hypothetical protein